MLLRETPAGLLAITQPAHAALSGAIAREWGNERFGGVEPFEETCLGAEQHDCGWLEWEQRPAFNPDGGRPFSFMEMRTPEHLDIWTRGPRLAGLMNPYAGLLVSLHGTGLYARYRADSPDPAVKAYVEGELERQRRLTDELKRTSRYARFVTPEVLERNRTLVAAWDLLSLFLCLGTKPSLALENVPGAAGPVTLRVSRAGADVSTVDPWPFRGDTATFHVSGTLLRPPFASREAMQDALERADRVTLPFRLEPAPA